MLREEARNKFSKPLLDYFGRIFASERQACEPIDFSGSEAVTDEVVEEEVMELVGSHYVLGFLCDFAVLCRQQLGTDGCCENITKHRRELFVAAVVRFIADEVTNERFGNGGVYSVHRHVVAVVGRPAESELGQVARADYHAAQRVRHVHQHLRALACLSVLIGHVGNALVPADVGEVTRNRFFDVDCPERHAREFGELLRV